MQVEIDQYGNMTIIPDGATEAYTLRKWWQDWEASRVCLSVKVATDSGVLAEETIQPPAPEGEG